jgi:hypothetical protein
MQAIPRLCRAITKLCKVIPKLCMIMIRLCRLYIGLLGYVSWAIPRAILRLHVGYVWLYLNYT